jgi:hypothetical protein
MDTEQSAWWTGFTVGGLIGAFAGATGMALAWVFWGC